MGQDYSYNQPFFSEGYDDIITCLLQAEADMYNDEAQSRYNNEEVDQYPPQPEDDVGILKTCYCGVEAVVGTVYTKTNPVRRYFTCANVDDGDCHVWKWWDVAVMKEMSEFQIQVRHVKDQVNDCEQKLVNLEKTMCNKLAKKK